jgi:predicted NUDIX family NTP pyrophosphohydrolase
MGKKSAGILAFRKTDEYQFLLAHPGGPFWAGKDQGAWSVPKGEIEEEEDFLDAAVREFKEETGLTVSGNFLNLDPVKQPGGKTIYIWAVEGDPDISGFRSNMFKMEWPVKSGKFREFPEMDKAGWFNLATARMKILKGQLPILEDLAQILNLI